MPSLQVGNVVQYVLDSEDVRELFSRRVNIRGRETPRTPNPEYTGKVCAMIVTGVTDANGLITANGKLIMDGDAPEYDLWVTSRPHGHEPGQWHKVPAIAAKKT